MAKNNKPIHPGHDLDINKGMTLLEYYSGLAMQGILSKYQLQTPEDQKTVCNLCIEIAQELIKQLSIISLPSK